MKSSRYKVYLALILVVALGGLGAVIATGTSPNLGLDLQGGISVILSAEGEVNEEILQKTVEIIRQRIDALGAAEPEVNVAGTENIFIQIPGVEDEERALELIGTTAQLTFREVLEEVPATAKKAPEVTEETDESVNAKEVVYPVDESPELLMRLAPAALTGSVVTRAEAVPDSVAGGWFVSINMNEEGARRWAELTSEQACQRDKGQLDRIAIVLDGVVVASPGMAVGDATSGGVVCDEGITGGESRIDVGNAQEAKDLALILRYGSLPITLEQSEVQKVSPTLGRDSLEAGIKAGILGLVLVMIYMVVYYRALGLVVWLGLAVFATINYILLSILGETIGLALTLAGVAGVIVSVGVTADSYIVSFERLKDEIRSGKTLRAAVDRGMTRAFRTILVADFVTGSAAVILFFLAVGPVRGFALTLGLATLVDIAIFYYFTRPAVNLLARTKLMTSGRFIGMRKALGAET